MRKKLLSILALLCLTVTSARAQWTGGTYTATATENRGAITVNADATLTINEGVTVTVTGGINVASGTLTVTGPGTLVVTGAKGDDGWYDEDNLVWHSAGNGGAAISGNIIVQGGATVTATGGNGADGGTNPEYDVKGYNGANGGVAISGNIIVQGGATVTATGGTGGTGGYGRSEGGKGGNGGNAFAGTLTYKSGTVTANGGSGGSGGTGGESGSSGSDANAFANNVDFTQSTGYSVTNGTSTIGSVLNQRTVVISGGIATVYNVTANQVDDVYWSTFYSNEGNYQASEGTQVFAVTLTGTAIEMTVIPNRIALSGKGVVLKNTTTGSITMTKTETAPNVDYSGSSLDGTMTSITNPSYGNIYVLNNGTYGVGFYKLKSAIDGGTIGANKAYLTYDGALAREFFLFDEATGINSATLTNSEKVNNEVYDLQGRRVVNPTKGLYIVNGKKVFINK